MSYYLRMGKYMPTSEQLKHIRRFVKANKDGSHFPKVFIDRIKERGHSYRVVGFWKIGEQEEITHVADSGSMTHEFFKNNILGEIADFMKVDDEKIEDMYRCRRR